MTIIDSIESLFGSMVEEKGLSFEVIGRDALPDVIRTDPTRLRQCLVNLVGNAIKFTQQGHVRMRISAGHFGDDNP